MVSGIFILITYIPNGNTDSQQISSPVLATAIPSSSILNSAYINTSFNGYENVGTPSGLSGTSTLTSVENTSANTLSETFPISWTQSSGSSEVCGNNLSLGNFYYYSGTSLNMQVNVIPPVDSNGYYDMSAFDMQVTIGNKFNNTAYTVGYKSDTDESFLFGTNFNPGLSTGTYPIFLYITIGTYDYNATYKTAPSVMTSNSAPYYPTFVSTTPPDSESSISFVQGWNYASQSVSPSWTNPSNAQAYEFTWSAQKSGTTSTLTNDGNYYPTLPTTTTFKQTGDPNVLSYTISWSVNNVVETESTSINSGALTQNATENQNWWNSSISYTPTSPSSWINGATVDGKVWDTTFSSYTIQHILSVGYGTSPVFDTIYYSGSISGNIVKPTRYSSFSETPNVVDDSSGTTITLNINELINYAPNSFTPSTTFANSGSTAQITFTTGEQISGEHENININWEDGTSTQLNNVAPTTFTENHTYTGNYIGSTGTISYTPVVTVTNLPNAPTSDNAQKNTVESSNTYSFSLTDNPTLAETVLHKGNSVFMNFTQSNLIISTVSATINGVSTTVLEHSPTSYSVSSSVFGLSPVIVAWTLDPAGIVDTMSIQYASPLYPTTNSTYLTTLFSNIPRCTQHIFKAWQYL